MLRLQPISADEYAHQVLPLTSRLWAGWRDFETYVGQTNDLARSAYGKRSYRTVGLYENRQILASCKRYERVIRFGAKRLATVGFGAVFTPAQFRARGYATAMLAMLMDEARTAGADVAYLFSDILPAFYAALGFLQCPSRIFSVRADLLQGGRIRRATMQEHDWRGIARCFAAGQARESWSFERSPGMWNWIRLRMRHGSEHASGQTVNLVVRKRQAVLAYVLGQREPAHDALIVDEFGWAGDEGHALVAPLLRNAAGDLRRVMGWMPPPAACETLPRGVIRKRKDAILMMAPLSTHGKRLVRTAAGENGVWATDHI